MVLVVSMIIHRKELSSFKLRNFRVAVVFLVVTILVVLFVAVDKEEGYSQAYILSTLIFASFCIVKIINNSDRYRLFLLAIVAMAANLSLNAYLYGVRVAARLEGIGSADSTGSNQFSLLLAGIIPLAIPFIWCGKWYEKIFCILALPFLVNAFILCNSRGAFVAVALAYIVSVAIVATKRTRKKMAVVAIALAPLFLYLADAAFFERLSTLLYTGEALNDAGAAQSLSSGRTAIWGYGVDMLKDYPFGSGPNGFKTLARFYMPEELLTIHPGAVYGVRAAHNTYLQVLVEQGGIGLAVWLALCGYSIYLLVRCSRLVQQIGSLYWELTVVGLSISYFSILFGGLFTSRLYYQFYWWQIALIAVLYGLLSCLADKSTCGVTVGGKDAV
ncbi:MAG: O-antigen ligase family protein [Thermodesulfobacteriota bacterium]